MAADPDDTQQDLGLTAIDLFSGAGGLTQGFKAAGFEVAYAIDRDLDSCDSYRANHPATKVEHASLTDHGPGELARLVGDVDVIVGGPSCQGFSTHGRRDPDDERNKLWEHMHGVVKAIKPRAFLLENVPGLMHFRDGKVSGELIAGFEDLGYSVHAQTLLAADFGVPQLRRRVIVVGVASGMKFEFPTRTHLGGWRRDTLAKWEEERQRLGLLRHITCGEAIADLPALCDPRVDPGKYTSEAVSDYARAMRGRTRRLRDHEAGTLSEAYRDLMAHVPPGGTWRDIPAHLLPDRYRGMRRTDSTNLLGRLNPDRPAYTITTQFNNVTAGCFGHPFENRTLSVREGARLQSFPDSYEFFGSLSSRCRQIGNAVPPRLAQHLAVAIAAAVSPGRKASQPRLVKSRLELHGGVLPPTEATRKRMVGQARHDTAPETAVRDALTALGLRFETNERPLPEFRREVDILFPAERVAVFIDGCFWHGCPKHSRSTKSNTKWWAEKIARNRERDAETNRVLRRNGYKVLRIWEHEPPELAAKKVARAIEKIRRGS